MKRYLFLFLLLVPLAYAVPLNITMINQTVNVSIDNQTFSMNSSLVNFSQYDFNIVASCNQSSMQLQNMTDSCNSMLTQLTPLVKGFSDANSYYKLYTECYANRTMLTKDLSICSERPDLKENLSQCNLALQSKSNDYSGAMNNYNKCANDLSVMTKERDNASNYKTFTIILALVSGGLGWTIYSKRKKGRDSDVDQAGTRERGRY